MPAVSPAEQYLDAALHALESETEWRAALDAMPVPIYVTDTEGVVTYCNEACAPFAGREPRVGVDRWCVTWQLYRMTGEFLPHDKCPMAEAIRQKRPIRGEVAIAARPDGSRVAFTPYPTPLFDSEGGLKGAVNMLVDVTAQQGSVLADQAERCRRLARTTHDDWAAQALQSMAIDYESTAQSLQPKTPA